MPQSLLLINRQPMIGTNWDKLEDKGGKLQYMHIKSPDNIHMEHVDHIGDYQFWKNLDLYGIEL